MRLYDTLRTLQITRRQNATRRHRALLILILSVIQFDPVHADDFEQCRVLLMDNPSLPSCHRVVQGNYPDHAKAVAHVNLGADYVKRRQYEQAIQEYTKSILLQTDSPSKGFVFGLRAYAMEYLGRIDAAIADLDNAGRLNQDQALSYLDRRDALVEKQRAELQAIDNRQAAAAERARKATEAREQGKREREQREQQEAAQVARLERERAERTERARAQHEQEERRLAELRAFSARRETCRSYDVAACEAALNSPHAAGSDATELKQWLGIALRFQHLLRACSSGTASACNEALASPALKANQRTDIERWREAASIHYRVSTFLAKGTQTIRAFSVETAKSVRDLQTPIHIASGIAAILALALGAIAYRARGRGMYPVRPGEVLETVPADDRPWAKMAGQPIVRLQSLWRSVFKTIAHARNNLRKTYAKRKNRLLPPRLCTAKHSAHAQRHLKNALTFFDKWEHAKYWQDRRDFSHFATQQIEQAKKYDINAKLNFIDQGGKPDTWTLKQFSAAALFYEAQNHMNDRRYRMAIRALSRALKYEPDTTQYQNMLAEAYIKWGRANRAKHILKNVKYPNFRTTQLWENIYRSPPLRVYPVLPAPKSWSKSRSAP